MIKYNWKEEATTSLNPNGTVLHVPWMGGHFISLQHLVTTQVPIISKQSAISP